MMTYSINTFPMSRFFDQIAPELDQLRRQMDELFETGVTATGSDHSDASQAKTAPIPTWRPRAAIQETDESYQLQLQLPGIDTSAIEIEARRDGVTVKGDRPSPSHDASPIHSEFRYGAFERRFRLPEEIQPQQVSAAYRDGILTLTLPKRTAAEDYKVKVAVALMTEPESANVPADGPDVQAAATTEDPKADAEPTDSVW